MLTTVWIGLFGALLMFSGDMLLYYTPKDFSYGPKSSAEEKINSIIDVMKNLPARRVMVGGMVGPVAAKLPKGVRIIISGGWTNLIFVIYYVAVLIVLW